MEQPVRAAPRRSAILLAALVKLPVAALIFFVGLAAGAALTMAAVNRVNRMGQARMATAPAPPEFSEGVYPATFIIDRDGRIVVRHLGTAKCDDPSVANFLRRLNDMRESPQPAAQVHR